MDYANVEVTVIELTNGTYDYHYSVGAEGTNPPDVDFVDGDGNLYLKDFTSDNLPIVFKLNANSAKYSFNAEPIYLKDKGAGKCRHSSPDEFDPNNFSSALDGGALTLTRKKPNNKKFCYALRFDVDGGGVIQDDPEIKNGGTHDLKPPYFLDRRIGFSVSSFVIGFLLAALLFFSIPRVMKKSR